MAIQFPVAVADLTEPLSNTYNGYGVYQNDNGKILTITGAKYAKGGQLTLTITDRYKDYVKMEPISSSVDSKGVYSWQVRLIVQKKSQGMLPNPRTFTETLTVTAPSGGITSVQKFIMYHFSDRPTTIPL